MNKLITVLYVLYFVSYMMGCSLKQSADYEIRLFMDRGGEVTGYVEIDGKKHSIQGEYND